MGIWWEQVPVPGGCGTRSPDSRRHPVTWFWGMAYMQPGPKSKASNSQTWERVGQGEFRVRTWSSAQGN